MTAVAFILPLILSWPLLGHDLPAGPSAGFALGIQTLGILPPPGYPLYLLLARGLSGLLPFGDFIGRIGGLSVLFAAGTTAMLYRIGRFLQFPNSVALSGSLAFACSGFFWPQALAIGPWSFHLFLLTICLYFTLILLLAEPSPAFRFMWPVWGCLCGITAGQEPGFGLWVLLLVGLGLAWYKAGWTRSISVLLALAAGLAIPYLYLPVRVFSPGAFINTDFVPQLSELIQSHSWGTAMRWAWWYLTGQHAVPSSAAMPLNAFIQAGWRSYTLLAMLVCGAGCLLALLGLLVQRRSTHAADRVMQLRVVIGILPLAAIPASWLLLQPGRQQLEGMGALAMTCWSLIGLDYCYHRLGHSDETVAKNKNTFITWFGLTVIVLLPVLAWWQSWLGLRQSPRPGARPPNLTQARALLGSFPSSSVLFFPNQQDSCIFEYLRLSSGLRPDLHLASVNTPWPGKYFGGRASMEFLGKTPAEQRIRRQNYLHYWTDGLVETVSGGTPTFLLVRPLPPDVRLSGLLGNLSLEPQSCFWFEWDRQGRRQAGGVFRLRLPPARASGGNS